MSLRSCPACAGQRLRPFRKGTYRGRLNEEQIKITDSQYGKTWDLSLCVDCGHLFANPCPSPAFLRSLYSRVEDPDYEAEASGRARNFLPILRRLEALMPAKGLLLDVGAATGILLDLARRRGWNTDGVEPSGWAVQVAAEKYGLKLRPGAFEEVELEENAYDAVTLIDLIEHTAFPFEVVRKARTILRPGGFLVLVTPDIHSPAARIAGRRWWHLRPAHLAFFSRGSLTALLTRAGLSIVKESRYAWTFSLHYLLSRQKITRPLLRATRLASFFKKIPIKLAFGDSFEIYARKDDQG